MLSEQERADLRKRAELSPVCMGLGGEERFVDHRDMVVHREAVLALLLEVEALREGLQDAIEFMKDSKQISIASRAIQLEAQFFGGAQ